MTKTSSRLVCSVAFAALAITPAFGQEKKPADKPKVEKPRNDIFSILGRQKKKAVMTTAISNAKQIFYLMVEFDQDYGEYPSDETAKELLKTKCKTSNDYFRQLFAANLVKYEAIFYAKGGSKTVKKPDEAIGKGKLLEAGEVGFAYYKDQSTASNMRRPLVCAPMTGKGTKFDPKPYGGKAVVLFCDGSVRALTIDKNGEAILRNGKKLFANGVGTCWGKDGFNQANLVFPK